MKFVMIAMNQLIIAPVMIPKNGMKILIMNMVVNFQILKYRTATVPKSKVMAG